MRKTLLALAFTFAALPLHAKTIKMEVNGLVCAFCAQGIDKKLRTFAPASDVFVSLEKRIVAVALKEGQDIPDATLLSSLKDSGYDVVSIARVDDTLEQVRAQAKKK